MGIIALGQLLQRNVKLLVKTKTIDAEDVKSGQFQEAVDCLYRVDCRRDYKALIITNSCNYDIYFESMTRYMFMMQHDCFMVKVALKWKKGPD